jgi:hypothetical protein
LRRWCMCVACARYRSASAQVQFTTRVVFSKREHSNKRATCAACTTLSPAGWNYPAQRGNYRSCVDSLIIRPSAGMADADHKADWRRTTAAAAVLASDVHHVSHRDTSADTSVGAGFVPSPAPTSSNTASGSAFGSSGPALRESQERARDRFILELEFVQCLASPEYLHWLSTNGYLVSSRHIKCRCR